LLVTLSPHFSACMLLLAFALFAPLLLLGFSLSFLSLVLLSVVMAHIKSTVVPRQSDDNVDLEVADASACEGVAGASSAFDQVTGESEAARGRKDRENSKTEAEEDDNMDDPKTVEGDDADSEAEARRKATKGCCCCCRFWPHFRVRSLDHYEGLHPRNGETPLFFKR
jgi:hypothetical protein